METFSLHDQLFHTSSCKVNYKCFLYSQALQRTTYLQSKLPLAPRRRAQSTASFAARRLAWPPATSAGTSASSISTCAHSFTHLLPDSKSNLSLFLSLVLEAAHLVQSGIFLVHHFVSQPFLQWKRVFVCSLFCHKLLALSKFLPTTSVWITSLSGVLSRVYTLNLMQQYVTLIS